MRVVSITEAKNGLSALIDEVRTGETVLITDRGRPVARLETAVNANDIDPSGRLARLERAGIVRVARRPAKPLEELPPAPKLREGVSIVQMVIEERRSGR